MKIFDSFYKQSAGLMFFEPQNENDYKNGLPTKGFGAIRYEEGSIYTGDIFFDGKKYNKLGFGKQEFYLSPALNGMLPACDLRKVCFVGSFDYRVTDWICGNGVMYYADENFKPARFVKGYFMGTFKTGEYQGEFDYSSLMPPFTKDMETDFSERTLIFQRAEEVAPKDAEIMLIGDSYFECIFYRDYYGKDYAEFLKGEKVLNLGLGGSTFYEWSYWKTRLKNYREPKKIFINLGFNDIHVGNTAKTIEDKRAELVEYIKSVYPNAQLYFFNVVHAPAFPDLKAIETEYNEGLQVYAAKNDAKVLDACSAFEKNGAEVFHADKVHPGPFGYELMEQLIKENI